MSLLPAQLSTNFIIAVGKLLNMGEWGTIAVGLFVISGKMVIEHDKIAPY